MILDFRFWILDSLQTTSQRLDGGYGRGEDFLRLTQDTPLKLRAQCKTKSKIRNQAADGVRQIPARPFLGNRNPKSKI